MSYIQYSSLNKILFFKNTKIKVKIVKIVILILKYNKFMWIILYLKYLMVYYMDIILKIILIIYILYIYIHILYFDFIF